MKSWFFPAGALVLVAAVSSAQSHPSGKVFMRYNKPLRNATLDLATGTITKSPAVHNKAAATVVDFDNNDLGGFVGVDTGNGFCEWFDAGTKGLGNPSDLMDDIVFAYCSAMASANSGGPGGSVKLGFYEGYTAGGGAATTAVAVFTLHGLPANSASSSFFGGFRCFFIQVRFTNLIAFADGPIGYSWKFIDVGTSATLGGTWPFLSCVVSCSGFIGQTDSSGMTDAIDEYCPPGTLRSTFTFGTASGSFTSMSMDIREAVDFAATYTPYNSVPPNTDILTAIGTNRFGGASVAVGGVCVGGQWTLSIARAPVTPPGACLVRVRTNRLPGPGFPAPPPVVGRILTAGIPLTTIMFPHGGFVGFSAPQAIPLQFAFVCLHFACQSVTTGGGVRLSSAIEGTTGTF